MSGGGPPSPSAQSPDGTTISVVVASYGRPILLRRCLIALAQCAHRPMEVIVIADKAGLEVVASLPFSAQIRTILQADPNLAQARNQGLAWARGDIVAFIDDDAVPEPTWATALANAFDADASVAAVTGPVVGRNGISLQWGPTGVDAQGRDRPLADPDAPLAAGIAMKLHGTNMAFRHGILMELGGFDPAFRFYLDDTDMSRRLHDRGDRAIYVPAAQVHHAFAASARRNAERVPLDLFDIGASTAAFLRKHAPLEVAEALDQLAEDQRARLFRFARKRKLGPGEIERLMHSLRGGISDGRHRKIGDHGIEPRGDGFTGLSDGPDREDIVLAGWRHSARRLREIAAQHTESGNRVTVLMLEATPRAHRMIFSDEGWWEQTGGLYGRSVRTDGKLQFWSFERRVAQETDRIAKVRFTGFPDVQFSARSRNATLGGGL